MRRIAILAAAVSGLIASSSFAGFQINFEKSTVGSGPNTRTAWDIYGFNTGGDTGTDLLAVTFLANSVGGSIHFQGSATTLRTTPSALQTPGLGGDRVTRFLLDFDGSAGSNGVVPGSSITPTAGPMGVNTGGTGNNADIAGPQLGAAIAADRDIPNGIVFPANTGLGRQFLRLLTDTTVQSIAFTDLRVAGDTGPTVTFGTLAAPYVIGEIVPEPTTLTALAGAAGLGLIRRRK